MTDTPSDEPRDRSTTRRRLLRGGAAAAGAALAPTLAGRASGADTITIYAALPADAPTYGDDDLVGLVVQVGDRVGDVEPSGVTTCEFVAQETAATEDITYTSIDESKIWGYNAEIVERDNVGGSGETTTLYALASSTTLGPEKVYIITGQQECGDYVQVQLEQLSESGEGPETTTPNGGGGGTTGTAVPGFGVLAAVGGTAAAAAGLAARDAGDDE